MIRTLYFICIIFVKKYDYILANINSESSIIFSLVCLYLIGQTFLYPSKFRNHFEHSATNSKNIFIYNLCFGLSKLYTNIQQDQKAKLDYHMSVLFAYMAGGGVRSFKIFCQRGLEFFLLVLCAYVCVGGRGGQVQYLSFPKKK